MAHNEGHTAHHRRLSRDLPASLLRRVETQTGLAPSALDAAVLEQFNALGWQPIPGSRYCPACTPHPRNGHWMPITDDLTPRAYHPDPASRR